MDTLEINEAIETLRAELRELCLLRRGRLVPGEKDAVYCACCGCNYIYTPQTPAEICPECAARTFPGEF